jgi:hypothetical protein
VDVGAGICGDPGRQGEQNRDRNDERDFHQLTLS